MAGERQDLTELFEEAVQELEDEGGLNPDSDLSWDQLDQHEPDFESDYHE